MSRICHLRPLHTVTYENGLAMQESLVGMRQRDEIPDQFLLLQHPPVITLGRGGKVANLLAGEEMLRSAGVRFFETTRGGDITYHGPGQIVGYPILHLGEGRRDVRKYVTKLEEVLIRTAADFGVAATRVEGRRGIWVGNDKLGAIGVRIARWVTSHGFAFNVDPELSHFDLITPCGLPGTGVTSLRRLTGQPVDETIVRRSLVRHFAEIYEREVEERAPVIRLTKAVVHDGERVLLLHRRPDSGDFWQPVTGAIHEGESALEAARREIEEETGQRAEPVALDLCQSFLIEASYVRAQFDEPVFTDEVAHVATLDSTLPIALDTEEHDAFGWFTFAEAYERIRWTDDREALEKVERRLASGKRPGHPEAENGALRHGSTG